MKIQNLIQHQLAASLEIETPYVQQNWTGWTQG
jgi:hypothetical protein